MQSLAGIPGPRIQLTFSERQPAPFRRYYCQTRSSVRARSVSTAGSTEKRLRPAGSAADPQAGVFYKDSWTDIAFIGLCRKAYGNIAGWQSERDWKNGEETYKGMVEVSKAMMKSRNARQQRDAVISGFPAVPAWFRRLFPYSKWGAEANAWITPTFFTWLVGPMEIEEAEVDGVRQRSQVHIKRCRYLAESGCAGMCVNLCKSPTQDFFTNQLGMPLTMQPNFRDYSCKMIFGQRPALLREDEATQQSCLLECSSAQSSAAVCHKLR